MSKKKRNSRGYSSRKVNTREVRQKFLIVCEGEKTEPNYFRSFRVPKNVIEIDVRGFGENPSRLVNIAKKLSEEEVMTKFGVCSIAMIFLKKILIML